MMDEHRVMEGFVVEVRRDGGGGIVLFIIAGFQMAGYGQSSELRDPAVVDTCWVGQALMQCLQPSQTTLVQSNTVVWGSQGTQQGEGAVKQQ